jgi:hypothetical protein
MRSFIFLSLAGAALILDAILFILSLAHQPIPAGRERQLVALAAPRRTNYPTQILPPANTPRPKGAAPALAPTPSPTAPPAPTITATPEPAPQLLAEHAAAFTPPDRATRANIRLALGHYQGALAHVFVAPGGMFSFNAALGPAPQRLPWKYVALKATAAPAPPAPEGATPAPLPAQEIQRIQGGGLCDLASRYVMAARPLLPARRFRFVNHVRSNCGHLRGGPARDSVSIWAVGGQAGEQDLNITNVTNGWLEFAVERDGETITVRARLWDRLPPG